MLQYPDKKALLRSSYLVRIPEPRYRLRGLKGSFMKYGQDPQEGDLNAGKLPASPDWEQEDEKDWGMLSYVADGLEITGKVRSLAGDYLQYEGIYGAIRQGAPLPVTAKEARDVIAIIEAAIQSSESRQIVPV